jgi:hypothetical protein
VGDPHDVAMLADTARFRTDDPDLLVDASFACPICLHTKQVERDLALDGYDPFVECCCPRCKERWRVYLAHQQALRLGLMSALLRR